jgi:hypothetical protein
MMLVSHENAETVLLIRCTNFPILHSQIITPVDITQAYTFRLRNSDEET